jgi:hypothetical protein
VRRTRGELTVTRVDNVVPVVVEHVVATLAKVGSVGVIVPDALVDAVASTLDAAGVGHAVLGVPTEFDSRLDVVPTTLAKGLEFDHVILLEPARIVAGEADHITGLRRLYVCLTRAVTSLVVVHSEALPAELGAP